MDDAEIINHSSADSIAKIKSDSTELYQLGLTIKNMPIIQERESIFFPINSTTKQDIYVEKPIVRKYHINIFTPPQSVDYKILKVVPDTTIDYKILIHDPK